MDMLTKVDAADPLLARTAVHRMGERLIDGTIRKPEAGLPLID